MALSEARSFTEPGDFAASIHGAEVELSLLAPGPFTASVTRVHLHSLRMQRFSESHPRIMHVAVPGDRAIFSFRTQQGAALFRSGVELTSNSIARLSPDQSYFQRSFGPVGWGCVSLPVDAIDLAGTTASGCDLTPPRAEMIVAAPPSAIGKLQRLHAATGLLAEKTPELIEQPEVARALENALVAALTACFNTNDDSEDRAALRRHKTIMRRFHSALQREADRPLYVLELAEMVGVSVRSLSVCCQEHLGMGPKKYLLLRRMYLARQALHVADSNATTVTDIATQYGFWQLGRFAVEYRRLFGESPSTTLQRAYP